MDLIFKIMFIKTDITPSRELRKRESFTLQGGPLLVVSRVIT